MNNEIRLAARPQGLPRASDFELEETPVPEPAEGEALIRNAFMSVDPYMRGRMNDVRSYVPPFELGEPLSGGAVGQVVESRLPGFAPGDWVLSMLGWREWAVSDGTMLRKLDPVAAPVSTALGVMGMPGLTAYVGLLDIGQLQGGETVFVSGAAGAVGSVAGQIAKLKGCRVIGSAGSDEKVAWLRELGLDAAFDYRDVDVDDALREAAPDGIDVYFDNVGGAHLEAALTALRTYGRVVACGSISRYNDRERTPGPWNIFLVVTKRLRVQGFIVSDHFDRLPAFAADMSGWLREGKVRYRETVVEGIENAPAAFMGLFTGENTGKMLVKVGPAPEDQASSAARSDAT